MGRLGRRLGGYTTLSHLQGAAEREPPESGFTPERILAFMTYVRQAWGAGQPVLDVPSQMLAASIATVAVAKQFLHRMEKRGGFSGRDPHAVARSVDLLGEMAVWCADAFVKKGGGPLPGRSLPSATAHVGRFCSADRPIQWTKKRLEPNDSIPVSVELCDAALERLLPTERALVARVQSVWSFEEGEEAVDAWLDTAMRATALMALATVVLTGQEPDVAAFMEQVADGEFDRWAATSPWAQPRAPIGTPADPPAAAATPTPSEQDYLLRVGSLFLPSRTEWPQGAQYLYRGNTHGGGLHAHDLALFVRSPPAEEVRRLETCATEFAFLLEEPVLFFLYRFEGVTPWCDAPYEYKHAEDEAPAVNLSPEDQAELRIFVVDACTGILRALRVVTLSHAFTVAFHNALCAQAATARATAPAFKAQLAAAYRRYRDPDAMAKRAPLTTQGIHRWTQDPNDPRLAHLWGKSN